MSMSISEFSTKKIAFLGGIAVLVLFVLIYIGSALSYRSACVSAEAGIQAQWKANQSSYDAYWKTVKEMAQVPDMYVADLEKVFKSAIQARYGTDGVKATFQFIQEHNPNFDPSLYTKIQTAIEAGRARFNADQTQLLDKKREYETILKSNTAMFVAMLFSFPTIELDKFDIVTSDQTEAAFVTGKTEALKLR